MRSYFVGASGLTVVNAPVTLLWLNPGASSGIEITRAWVAQSGSTAAAMQRVQIVRQPTSFPTVVSTTPVARSTADPTSLIVGATNGAAGTCGVNASAEGAGSKTVIVHDVFSQTIGWLWTPASPDERIVLPPGSSQGFGIYLPAAPAALGGWCVGVHFRELS